MCTSLALPTSNGGQLFGRTLDLDTHFGERVVLTPRGYRFGFDGGSPQPNRYAMLGMAAVANGYPLYAEAMNQQGLCMAGLRFAGNAVYADGPMAGKRGLAPWELIPYLLGRYATVNEVRDALREVCVVDRPFSASLPAAPLHWHIADADPAHGALVVESTAEGMRVYEDPPRLGGEAVGVLTNNPPYPYQLARYADYTHLTPAPRGGESHDRRVSLASAVGVDLTSLGEGGLGLPGDYSSPSRFVRAATLRRWTVAWMDGQYPRGEADRYARADREVRGTPAEGNPDRHGEVSPVAQFFRILAAVSPMAGAVMTEDGRNHRTLYTCCMDTAAGVYHYFTEGDVRVRSVGFEGVDTEGEILLPYFVL